MFLLFKTNWNNIFSMITTTTTANSKVTANIVDLYENDIAGVKTEIRMLTQYGDKNDLLPYYEAALEILLKKKIKKRFDI